MSDISNAGGGRTPQFDLEAFRRLAGNGNALNEHLVTLDKNNKTSLANRVWIGGGGHGSIYDWVTNKGLFQKFKQAVKDSSGQNIKDLGRNELFTVGMLREGLAHIRVPPEPATPSSSTVQRPWLPASPQQHERRQRRGAAVPVEAKFLADIKAQGGHACRADLRGFKQFSQLNAEQLDKTGRTDKSVIELRSLGNGEGNDTYLVLRKAAEGRIADATTLGESEKAKRALKAALTEVIGADYADGLVDVALESAHPDPQQRLLTLSDLQIILETAEIIVQENRQTWTTNLEGFQQLSELNTAQLNKFDQTESSVIKLVYQENHGACLVLEADVGNGITDQATLDEAGEATRMLKAFLAEVIGADLVDDFVDGALELTHPDSQPRLLTVLDLNILFGTLKDLNISLEPVAAPLEDSAFLQPEVQNSDEHASYSFPSSQGSKSQKTETGTTNWDRLRQFFGRGKALKRQRDDSVIEPKAGSTIAVPNDGVPGNHPTGINILPSSPATGEFPGAFIGPSGGPIKADLEGFRQLSAISPDQLNRWGRTENSVISLGFVERHGCCLVLGEDVGNLAVDDPSLTQAAETLSVLIVALAQTLDVDVANDLVNLVIDINNNGHQRNLLTFFELNIIFEALDHSGGENANNRDHLFARVKELFARANRRGG